MPAETQFNKHLLIQNLREMQADRTQPYPLGYNDAPRGGMTFVNNNGQPINLMAFVEFTPEKGFRGRHKHQIRQESLYVVSGTLQARYWLDHEDQAESHIHHAGTLITMQPGLFHEFVCIDGPALAFEFSPQTNNPDDFHFPVSV